MGLLFQRCLIQIKTPTGTDLTASWPDSLRSDGCKKRTNPNSPHSISVGAVVQASGSATRTT